MKKFLPYTLSVIGLVSLSLFYYYSPEQEQEVVLYDEIELEDTILDNEAEVEEEGENAVSPEEEIIVEEEEGAVLDEEAVLGEEVGEVEIEKVFSVQEEPSVSTKSLTTYATTTYPECDTADIVVGDYIISACNVGASVAGTGESSYGYHFQRGRNRPFPHTAMGSDDITANATTTLAVNPQRPYIGDDLFIKTATDPYDWSDTRNDDLRGGAGDTADANGLGTQTDRQGPCAVGYYVPSALEWKELYEGGVALGAGNGGWDDQNGDQLRDTLLLPMAGRRLYDSAIVDLYNNNGRYWSSSLSSTSPTNASNFSLRPSSINPNTSNVRSLGYSVRCFKNDIRNEICNRITDIPKAECKALVDFYYSTNGDGWTNGSGGASTRPWLTGSTACNRYGLTCAGTAPNKYVSKIVLGNNNLSGVLNPSLSVLNGLGSLDIYTNQIKGTLPSEYTEWTKLTAFDVSHNQLTGILPLEYGNARTGMRLFRVQDNHLVGEIPDSYCNRGIEPGVVLSHFSVSDNDLTGTLPDKCIESFKMTRIIELGNNHLDLSKIKLDEVPHLFLDLTEFHIGNSNVGGYFSSGWENYLSGTTNKGLRYLDISNNKITGEIPDYLQNYPWGTGAGIGTSVGRDYALNIKNNCLDTTNIQDPLLSFLNQRAELDWQTTQNACAVPPPSPTPSTNGGGGGVSLTKDKCPNGDSSPSYYDGECGISENYDTENVGELVDEEHNVADDENGVYERAKENGLTSMQTYEDFRPNDEITRAEMAKIVSLYAERFFTSTSFRSEGRDVEKCTQFTDLNQTNPELQSYIIQACKFGLMGYYSDGVTVKPNFDPNAKLPLTELATTISRLLRGEKYKGSGEWRYQSHLLALQKAGIIPFNLDPMKNELREEVYGILQKITE